MIACAALGLVPVASASASAASIKAVFRAFNARVEIAEGRVLTAEGEFEREGGNDPGKVQSAIGGSLTVLHELKAAVARQPASKRRVQRAKKKIVAGLQEVIVGYERLLAALGEKASNPQAAKIEAEGAVRAAKSGRAKFLEGLKLLR